MERDTYRRMAESQDKHWWYEGRRRILAHLIGALNLPPNATILEAGCGPGANLKMLSRFGAVSAFEPDEDAKNHAVQISSVNVASGVLPQPVPFSTPFDLVGAFDVIEHIDNDQDSVKTLFDLTKHGGYGVFTVPAYQWLWSAHDEANHHKRRYTKSSFKAVLEQAGYNIEKISYYNTWLFPLIVGVRAVKKFLNIADSPDETPPKLDEINDILCAIFTSERHVLKHCALPFGVSLIAVCRKPCISLFKHFMLFGGVGAINTVVSLAVIFGLSKGWGMNHLLANAIGYAVGVALGFALHKFITFRATSAHGTTPSQFKLFLIVFAVAYAVQFVVLLILVDGMGWNDILAQLIACLVYTVMNFLGNRCWTFQKRKNDHV